MNEKIKINLNNVNRVREFIQVARGFYSDVDVFADSIKIDGKSILGIYALDLSRDVYTRIVSDSEEEINRFAYEMEKFK